MKQLSKSSRRALIIFNFLSVILIIFFFYLGKFLENQYVFFIGGGISLLLTIVSFLRGFSGSGLWKMVHSGSGSLDERQMQVLLKAMKYSYSVFVIVCLIIIYGFALMNKGPVNVVVAACLLYFAHTLPAAIIGWNEKFV